LRRIKIKPIVVASTLIIIGGIGGLPLGCPWSISAALVTIGIIGNLWYTFHSEKSSEDLLALIDAQAALLSHKKLGNTYVEKLKNDLDTKGKTTNFHVLMNKALKNDPDNPDVILFYSRWLALWLSHCQRFKFLSEDHILNECKKLIAMSENSLRQDPSNYWQRDVLGIVYDVIGLHEKARDQFYQSGNYRNDPYWLSLVATSWMMEDKCDKALECIENALSKGAKGLEYEYGGILQYNGRYQEAFKYLRKAFKQNPFKAETVDELFGNMRMQCKFISASRYAFILSILKIKYSIKQSLNSLYAAFFHLFLGLFTGILRFVVLCINVLRFPKIITRKINIICEPHSTIGIMLIKRGHYEQAEKILTKVAFINNIRILGNLAISQAHQEKISEALSTVDKALRIYKNDETLKHNREAYSLALNGNKLGCLVRLDKDGLPHVVNKTKNE
jgi:tetratricopeptide (TPR) repeat protein